MFDFKLSLMQVTRNNALFEMLILQESKNAGQTEDQYEKLTAEENENKIVIIKIAKRMIKMP